MALTVLNPRFKIKYFKDKWTGNENHFLRITKLKVKKLWNKEYKYENVIIQPQLPLSLALPINYLTNILDQVVP